MLANGLGFLALFALISTLLGDDSRRETDPKNNVWFWTRYGVR